MTVYYNRGIYTENNQELYVIRSIVGRYIEVMEPKDPLVGMQAQDQELFYNLRVLWEVIIHSDDIIDMWNWTSPADIRNMLIVAGSRKITTPIDQKYIEMFINLMDENFDRVGDNPEEYIAAYYGTLGITH